jgi:hypothetical protein
VKVTHPLNVSCVTAFTAKLAIRDKASNMKLYPFFCPWCNQPNELPIDPGELGQQVVVDCRVCCRPIVVDLPDEPDGEAEVRGEGQ